MPTSPTTIPTNPTAPAQTAEQLLEVRDLKTYFFTRKGIAKVLDGLNFQVAKGEIVGLVGESGSGKSVTGFSLVRLLKHPGRIVGGQILFEGRDLTKLSDDQIQELRGREISMVFQNPRSSLNPVLNVGQQITQVLRYRRGLSKRED